MFSQQDTLNKIKIKVSKAFQNIRFWPHDIDHLRNVALYGKEIAKCEAKQLAPKMNLNPEEFVFLVEVACWFHDLGRSVETEKIRQDKNWNHALKSVELAKKIYDNPIVLKAVFGHNQAKVKHPENLITKVLQDADRGEGFGFRGMMVVFNYNNILNTPKLVSEKECQQELIKQWPLLMENSESRKKVIHWLAYLSMWYTGSENVSPIFTNTAKKLYKQKFEITKKYLELAKSWKTHSKNF
jgi:hypothetical protein